MDISSYTVNAEDEWPEEETNRKSKKNKKKGGKNEPQGGSVEGKKVESDFNEKENIETTLETTVATAEDEWPEEKTQKSKKGKKAPNPSKAGPLEAKDEEKEEAPVVKVLSKKEKEKLKKQRQKEAEKAQSVNFFDDISHIQLEEEAKPVPSSAASSKNRKKGGMTISLLQQMMAEQRAAEEAERKRIEEEKRKEEEELKRIEEEDRIKEEERRIKKEKEKARKEQLKKEGKLLTKAQKEKELRNRQRLEHLLAAGVTVPGMLSEKDTTGEESEKKQKKGISRQKKKPNPPVKEEPLFKSEPSLEAPSQPSSVPKKHEQYKPVTKPTDKAPVKSLEKQLKPSKPSPQPQKKEVKVAPKVESEDEIKACWEDESGSEEEQIAHKRPTKVKTAWDDSEDEDEKEETEEDEVIKKHEAILSKTSKQVKQMRDVSVERPSSPKSPHISPTGIKKSAEKPSTVSTEPTLSEKVLSTTKETRNGSQNKKQPTARKSSEPEGDLRSPICCILGHVDTGKTKLLDKIRQTNVQDGEAGGITQQIGATYFPVEAIKQKTQVLHQELEIKVPGLLIIDTPGHESFTNLRSRGSSLCNMAILVVDIMHGLEPQTLESLNLLRERKTPFIVALNKIDRIYDWKTIPDNSFVDSIEKQSKAVKQEFEARLNTIILAFAEQGLNARLYSKNENMGKYVSIVPTSAITGEGIPDMLYLLIYLTQTRMSEKIKYVGDLEATVLEVKVVEGLGTTIDVILSNGVLNESDAIVVCGLEGPILTHIRALLTPQPLRELRVKAQYIHHKHLKAAMGVKISANGLEKAVAGSRLLVVKEGDDEEELKNEVMADLQNLLASVDKSGKGVWVQASTLGSLEALLSFLKSSEIPVSGMQIGPVHKKDVMKASIMLERAKEFAVMLCFDVKIDKDAQDMADDMGVKVFKADIIYHLFDQFTAYYKDLIELRRQDALPEAVFPCVLKMVPGAMFNQRDPIVLGVDVVDGVLRIGTPICVVGEEKKVISLGKVTSIEQNHKPLTHVKKGQPSVAVKIECPPYEHPKMFGRHFNEKSDFYSLISRQSIDVLKENFKHEMQREDWNLIIKLKSLFGII